MQWGKISIFATFGSHLGFLRKMKKCEYLEKLIPYPMDTQDPPTDPAISLL